MKILLLTDIPPCRNYTAGLVLDQLCRFLPRGSIVCFAIVNPHLDARLTPDLDWIPIAYTAKRREGYYHIPRIFVPLKWTMETMYRRMVTPRLARQVIEFGRSHKVDTVWAVLQGQTLTQLAPWVARKLDARLISHVWDPLSWWLHAHNVDRLNRRKALRDFDRALTDSQACMAASGAMAREYESRYGTRSVAVIASHPADWAQKPRLSCFPKNAIHIGMAGQFYAAAEWMQLVHALNMSGWQVRGRPVRITVLGAVRPPGAGPPGSIEYLGWQSQCDAIRLLSDCDLLYCPYPFADDMAEVARLSFPSKAVLYLAAGRPILFHGPDTSSPAVYFRERGAALIVNNQYAAAIYNGLCRLVDRPEDYEALGLKAQQAFQVDFTLRSMRANFEQAFNIALDEVGELPWEPTSALHLPDVSALPGERLLRSATRLARTVGVPFVRTLRRFLAAMTIASQLLSHPSALAGRGDRIGLIARALYGLITEPRDLPLRFWINRRRRERDLATRAAADFQKSYLDLSRRLQVFMSSVKLDGNLAGALVRATTEMDDLLHQIARLTERLDCERTTVDPAGAIDAGPLAGRIIDGASPRFDPAEVHSRRKELGAIRPRLFMNSVFVDMAWGSALGIMERTCFRLARTDTRARFDLICRSRSFAIDRAAKIQRELARLAAFFSSQARDTAGRSEPIASRGKLADPIRDPVIVTAYDEPCSEAPLKEFAYVNSCLAELRDELSSTLASADDKTTGETRLRDSRQRSASIPCD